MSNYDVTGSIGDLSVRLAEVVRPKLVAPRQSTEQDPEPAAEPPQRDLVIHKGRMYVLAGSEGPRFVAATWLRPARRLAR